MGGRPDTPVAIQAIRDIPIIEHGSFAADPKYLELKQDLRHEYGYSDTDAPDENEESPPFSSHHGLGRMKRADYVVTKFSRRRRQIVTYGNARP
jgi:hypothetical protein